MGLETSRRPYPLDGGGADALGLGHRAAAPVRLTGGLFVQRRLHDRRHLVVGDRGLAAAAGLHLPELLQPLLFEAGAPRGDAAGGDPELPGDRGVRRSLPGEQQRLGAGHVPMWRRLRLGQLLEDVTLAVGHRQRRLAGRMTTSYHNHRLFARHYTSTGSAPRLRFSRRCGARATRARGRTRSCGRVICHSEPRDTAVIPCPVDYLGKVQSGRHAVAVECLLTGVDISHDNRREPQNRENTESDG